VETAWAGYLGLLSPREQAGELDRLLAERVSALVALELLRQRAIAEATHRGRGELLADLLDGSFPNFEAILGRGQQLGYDLLSPHLVFRLAADALPAGQGESEGRLSAARQRRRFAEVARATLLRRQPRSLAIERDGALVALLPTAEADDPAAATELVEQVRLAVGEALPEVEISAGVGRPLTHPSAFGRCHEEAGRALAIAQRLLGGGRTVHYDTAGIERLLVHLLGNPELELFASETLGDLLAYDQQHRGELVHTLDVFLRCNGNHVRAAEQLHLHRNTLLYRLERARQILGREIEDADTRLALQVALRIRGALPAAADPVDNPPRVVARRRRAG
jgi:purine catabolism regulator